MEDITTKITDISVSIDMLWVLIAAAMVMFMQPGFAMVEAGFTRAKNTANILMKNFLDFSVGSLMFWVVGFSIMFGTDLGGFIGMPDLFFSGSYGNDVDYAILIFQTVFAATAATIVSGAVAERTEFKAYILASFFITAVIYPVSGHWVWGGGWLSELGFHDFAGSTVVHSVGGWLGLVGTAIIGPRLGKYNGKRKAIPGHSLTIGALGVFILWFGWFGFNPGSQLAASGLDNISAVASIFVTTNLSASAGTVTAMIISWIRYKRPSLGLSLNGALAGLVAITAGCDVVSPGGAVIIGIVAGITLIFGVEMLDTLKIDDPVGAVTVHGFSGAVGTILVGLLATEGGLFYGGGASMLGVQTLGVVAIAAWALSMGFILFRAIKSTVGLRVPRRVEEEGLDVYEHGETAYNNFS